MITMKQYEQIRTAHRVYGKGIREISRELGHSRPTIRKALRGQPPGYTRRQAVKHPVMDAYGRLIDQWLQDDQSVPKKQRHTAHRMYERLVAEYAFCGAESTVRQYVRKRRQALGLSRVESMIPRIAEVGKEAEVDWGEAEVYLGHRLRTVFLFCLRSRYSGKGFVRAYPTEKQEMFFDGHQQAFEYFGGVFPTLVYDNSLRL